MAGDTETRVAVVTGANRGLGLQTAKELASRGWQVVAAARRPEAVPAAEGIVAHALDLDDDGSVEALAAFVAERFGRLDALVNNAGVIAEEAARAAIAGSRPAEVAATLQNNAVGSFRVTQALLPLMNGVGNIVNVSSGMGALGEMGGGFPGYRMSKAALNALTRVTHAETPATLRCNSVCPGWVRTEMGGANATRSVEEGAAGIVWAATLGEDGPSGGFFRDGQPIDW